jgi:hypothetical protein
MKRLVKIGLIALPLATLAAAPAFAEVKTRDKTTVKFEGRLLNLFLGKAAKEGVEQKVAVKGNRKATINDRTGTIVDLSEEKVYDLDMKKKTYTVTTFEELRRRMRESAEKAEKETQKEEPGQAQQEEKPKKEYEIDFDVKDTGQKKQVAGYDTHETIATVTVREKGKTLEDAGGLVMTTDMWLGPKIPALKELVDFDIKYAKALEGPEAYAMSAEQMAALLKMFPLLGRASDRLQKEGDKLAGTPLESTVTFETVKSKEDLEAAQKQGSSGGGGISGMLAKKVLKQEPPKARSTFMTTHDEKLEVATSVASDDLAIPADFKEKK